VSADSAAEDEEFAAAVLWNDNADPKDWNAAWAACVHADSLLSGARPANPGEVFRDAAGLPSPSVDSGGGVSGAGASDGGLRSSNLGSGLPR
jgi:hypothetical protein